MQTIKLFFVLLFCCCISTIKVNAQCTGCTITASPGGNYNLNSGDVLCITSSLGNLGLNVNGGKICVASGVTWTQTSGFNTASGFVINVYGSMVVGPSANIGFNGSTTFNVFQGGSLEVQSNGFNSNNQLTVNNEGNVSFTNTGSTVFQGTFNNRPTGTLTATMQPGSSDVFKFANGSIVTNEGIMTFTNLENEETQLFDNAAGATVTIGRYFYNHGNMFNYGKVETLCGPFGTAACEFIVGNKGPGKEFVNACCAVFNSNVTVKGGAKNNGSWVIKSGYNLDLQFVISGTNGALLVEGGNSQISCGGGYRGTNMTFYDANTPGNDFDSKCINVPSDAVYTVSNPPNTCCGVSPVTCTTPSAPTLSVTDNICPATTGSINVTTACGAGTRIEYSTDNGSTWSATAPTYGSSPITVVARCVTNSDATCFSPNSAAVTTAPVTCPPPVTCTPPSAPALSVTNNICPATTGSINVTTACGAGTRIEYSTDNGSTWSATAPTYGSSPITVVARCVTNSDATCFSPNSAAVTTAPVTCPPPVTCTTPSAPALSVTNNICPATTGSINVTTACGAGTRIEYSTDNGSTWSATAPTYGSSPITVVARCVTNSDATCFSPNSAAVTTAPVTCPPPVTCTPPSAPALSVTNNICPATTGSINVTTACGAGTRIEYSTDNGSTWSATAPTYGSSPITVVARCVTNSDATCFSPNSAAVTTAPVTCPPPPPAAPCSITITQQTQSVCNNNGTGRRAQDDYFTVSINATAISGGAQYEVVNLANTDGTGGNPLGFATYGTAVTVGSSGNLIANNTAFTLTIRDTRNNACFKTITLNPVPPCSSNAGAPPPNGPCGAVPCAPIKVVKN